LSIHLSVKKYIVITPENLFIPLEPCSPQDLPCYTGWQVFFAFRIETFLSVSVSASPYKQTG